MGNNKLVSVLMSTYNENQSELSKAIESVLNQDYRNIEFIIVVDNPENKKGLEVINFYKQKDDRVRLLINEKNLGLVHSLNKGLKICKGKYIARMDADDICVGNRISKQVEFLEKNRNVHLVGTNIILIDESDNEIPTSREVIQGSNIIKETLKYRNCIAHSSWMFEKRILEDFKISEYRDIHYCEDFDLLIRLILNGGNVENMKEKLVKYRIRSSGISKSNAYKQIVMINAVKSSYRKSLRLENYNYLANTIYLYDFEKKIKQPKIFNIYMRILYSLEKANRKLLFRILAILCQMLDKDLLNNFLDRFKVKIKIKNFL